VDRELQMVALRAARTAGSRTSSVEPRPHHDEMTSSMPAAAISAIC
jgi:hypothetical protein